MEMFTENIKQTYKDMLVISQWNIAKPDVYITFYTAFRKASISEPEFEVAGYNCVREVICIRISEKNTTKLFQSQELNLKKTKEQTSTKYYQYLGDKNMITA